MKTPKKNTFFLPAISANLENKMLPIRIPINKLTIKNDNSYVSSHSSSKNVNQFFKDSAFE
jgi:hypothetical protein